MPVTARLSRKFYETFGDEIANEFVDWFNNVDATYRTEFRELFQTNFDRFDAKVEQRVGQLNARLEQRLAEVKAHLRQEIGDLRTDLLRWMFVYWAGSVVTTVGLVLTVLTALRP